MRYRKNYFILAFGVVIVAGLSNLSAWANEVYTSPQTLNFGNGVILEGLDLTLQNFQPDPNPGGSATFNVSSFFDVFVSVNDGGTFETVTGTGTAQGQVTPNGFNSFFDVFTELDLSGTGSGLPSVKIRLDPGSQPTPPPGSDFPAQSFFDIFTDISLDGGQTWAPANAPILETVPDATQTWPLLLATMSILAVSNCNRLRKRLGEPIS